MIINRLFLIFVVLFCISLITFPVQAKYSGGTGEPNKPYRIDDANDMNEIGLHDEDWGSHFILVNDINLADYTGTQFNIIGISEANAFTGVFDGNYHTISNFTYADEYRYLLGLFGALNDPNALIKNLTLTNPIIDVGSDGVGILVGCMYNGEVSNCAVEGGIIYADAYSYCAGGLIGGVGYGDVSNCHTSISIYGKSTVGGLIGGNNYGTISNCSATGSVRGQWGPAGGLIGGNINGDVSDCYAICNVNASHEVGGLVGTVGWFLGTGGAFTNCFAAGKVEGYDYVGGLIGEDLNAASYSTCFWDSDVNPDLNGIGNANDPNVIGKTTAEMQTESTFTSAGWDFVGEAANGTEDIWRMCVDDVNYPMLWWEFIDGDFVCPDGVDGYDLGVLCEQWLFEELPADVAPEGGDGVVNFLDWAVFAESWQITEDYESLADFAEQWLKTGASYLIADIAPEPDGDGFVNLLDFAALADNWLWEE